MADWRADTGPSHSLSASRLHVIRIACFLFFCSALHAEEHFSGQLLKELNAARMDPRSFISTLEKMLPLFSDKSFRLEKGVFLETHEGAGAVEEAIDFLRKQEPLEPFRMSAGLSHAALDHARDLERGGTGHKGSDGSQPWDRAQRYGEWIGQMAENIHYGTTSPRGVVVSWIVDDGIRNRGHRKNLFTPDYRKVGIASASHPEFGSVYVLDLAGDFQERH